MKPIDSIRGIFALLIIWHHYAPMMHIYYPYDFGNTIVLFFFMLSGFHIAINWIDKIQNSSYDFIIKRCSKLFPLQWITVILHVIFGVNIVLWWVIPFHLTLTQSLNPMWQSYFSINGPTWFTSSLFICYLLTPAILNFARRKRQQFFCLLTCAVVLCLLTAIMLPDNIGRRWLFYINPFARVLDYSTGMMLGIFYSSEKFKRMISNNSKLYTALEVIFVFLIVFTMTYEPISQFNSYTSLRYPIVLIFIILFSLQKGYISRLLSSKYIAWLGSVSMSMYMIHSFILYFAGKIMNIPLWIHIIATYTCILFASYYMSKILPSLSKMFVQTANKIHLSIIGR